MAYPAYETVPQMHRSLSYGQQYAYPPAGVAYSQPLTPGVYDSYGQGAYQAYTPGRSISQYGGYTLLPNVHNFTDSAAQLTTT
ncbi:hypothetical protein EVJ58_g397 [Rhodofomes roseus]|uniref:Uncharacterized protein n=1 Tax=Rhodofomes roseus TaxID=34475 RepID=A0A4Y9Z478_9APHY|nr:hypothetical protein EVJ58_g397 [Rhodofomes roseus]